MTIGQFEATVTTSEALANNMVELINQCGLKKKIIAYVKDEGLNLNVALKLIVRCDFLSLDESFQGTLFWPCIF
jgi:hypothetical protein